jgi:tetratricopeptide (TPR) repeat protein
MDEAAAAYEEAIRRDEQRKSERDVAVGKAQLGSVRMEQRRYQEALGAFEAARERFESLNEPGSVAASLHSIGMVYQEAGQPEAAEDAYRKSLATHVRLGDLVGQATTLLQLGILYDNNFDRTEEAAAFFQQAADKFVEVGDTSNEGRARSNLALTLRKLRHFDQARQEIGRAIQCDAQFGDASEPWKTWAVLADIEKEAGNRSAAAEAKRRAIEHYLAYRREGGENYNVGGRIFLATTQHLAHGDHITAESLLQEYGDANLPGWLGPFVQPLRTIVAGSRDRSLADADDLHFTMAAEILLLIETLEKHEQLS